MTWRLLGYIQTWNLEQSINFLIFFSLALQILQLLLLNEFYDLWFPCLEFVFLFVTTADIRTSKRSGCSAEAIIINNRSPFSMYFGCIGGILQLILLCLGQYHIEGGTKYRDLRWSLMPFRHLNSHKNTCVHIIIIIIIIIHFIQNTKRPRKILFLTPLFMYRHNNIMYSHKKSLCIVALIYLFSFFFSITPSWTQIDGQLNCIYWWTARFKDRNQT